jgi:hypothetical protein
MPKRRDESSDHDTDRYSDTGNDKSSSGNKQNKQSSKHARSDADGSDDDEQGSRNSNSIPIFLKKTYRMIETCDPSICSWTKDGEMFVVKNPVRSILDLLIDVQRACHAHITSHLSAQPSPLSIDNAK